MSSTSGLESRLYDGVVVEDAAWSYDDPLPESSRIAGFSSFDPTKVDLSAALPQAPS